MTLRTIQVAVVPVLLALLVSCSTSSTYFQLEFPDKLVRMERLPSSYSLLEGLLETGSDIRIEIVHSSIQRIQSLLSADENHKQI